jgi:outer membrane protein OmpA-like peptidoglycan-associated protein
MNMQIAAFFRMVAAMTPTLLGAAGAAWASPAPSDNPAMVGGWDVGHQTMRASSAGERDPNPALVGFWGVGKGGSHDRHSNPTLVGFWGVNAQNAAAGPARGNNPALVGTWAFSGDSDGDGVLDEQDHCANTPRGAVVDSQGCPVDSDGDAVPDGIDQCANTPRGAKVDAKGCTMDSDGDGVVDGIDQCGSTPKGAKVDARGCPVDSDGDGIPDGVDQCADTARGAKVDAKGCPKDSDGDGVPDGIDQCADTPKGAKIDAKGCPITPKEAELLDTGTLRLQQVYFDSREATLKPESYPALDEVGQILTKWPQLKLEVGGHTDNRAGDAFNKDLSQKRAQAVLDYLVQKFSGINRSQFTVVGYGESQPLTSNGTDAGRAQNRRVEFKVLNREVLKK